MVKGHRYVYTHLNFYVHGGVLYIYRGTDKSLAQPGRKQARKHDRDARNFNNTQKQAIIKFFTCKARRQRTLKPFWQKH